VFVTKAERRPALTIKPPQRNGLEECILDGADRLLAQRGYGEITMDDLAAAAGVSKSTIYQRFQSKENVVLAHIDRIVERVEERLEQIANGGATPANKIKQMVVARVMIRFHAVQHYTQSLAELLREIRPGLLARRERYFQREAQIFARVILQGERAGVFRKGAPERTARALIAATNSLLPFSLTTREIGMPRTTEEAAITIADLVLYGLMRPEKAGCNAEPPTRW